VTQLPDLAYTSVIPDASVMSLFLQSGMPLMAASNNPFGPLMPSEVQTEITVEPGVSRTAELVSVVAPKATYKPGDKLEVLLTYRPYQSKEQVRTVTYEIPREVEPGSYTLTLSDAETFQQAETMSRPEKFHAETVRQVVEVLREAMSFKSDALYLRLSRSQEPGEDASVGGGLAVGRKALMRLPDSRRQIIENGGKPEVTPISVSETKVENWNYVSSGSVELNLTIDAEGSGVKAGEKNQSSKPGHPGPSHGGMPGKSRTPGAGPGGGGGMGPGMPGDE
jgi:hypothetical protein